MDRAKFAVGAVDFLLWLGTVASGFLIFYFMRSGGNLKAMIAAVASMFFLLGTRDPLVKRLRKNFFLRNKRREIPPLFIWMQNV
jgi:hypothetical protein